MPYSTFTLSRAVEDFDLAVKQESNLFAAIPPVVPTPLPEDICLDHNRERADRQFGEHVIKRHVQNIRRSKDSNRSIDLYLSDRSHFSDDRRAYHHFTSARIRRRDRTDSRTDIWLDQEKELNFG